MRRRVLLIVFMTALAAGGALFVTWFKLGQVGTTPLEEWIGRYLLALVESYVNPRVNWAQLDYQAPLTVVIDDARLTHESVDLLHADQIKLGLHERPKSSQPVQIEQIDFQRPRIRLIRTPKGAFVGWSNFLCAGLPVSSQSTSAEIRLSDALRMQELTIADGELLYDPATDQPSMLLDGLNLTLHTPVVRDNPGSYRFTGVLTRNDLLHIDLDGNINFDTALLRFDRFKIKAEVNESRYDRFPPEIQRLLVQYQLRGVLEAELKGQLSLSTLSEVDLEARLRLTNARLALGGTPVDVHELNLNALLTDSAIRMQYDARLPNGTCEGKADVRRDSSQSTIHLAMKISNVATHDLFVAAGMAGAADILSGNVSANLTVDIDKNDWRNTTGQARIDMAECVLQLGKYRIPLDRFTASATLNRRAIRAQYSTSVLGGAGSGELQLGLDGSMPLSLSWSVRDALFDKIVSGNTKESQNREGRFQTTGSLTADLERWPDSMRGSGTLSVEDVQMVSIPFFSELMGELRSLISHIPLIPRDEGDRGTVEFHIQPDRFVLDRFDMECAFFAARGSGDVFHDRRVELVMSTGPIEKLQSLLGQTGLKMGTLFNPISTYRVHGTLDDPIVELRPLGLSLP